MGGACFLQEMGQTHTVPFSATFEWPAAPIVLPLYHKNSAHKRQDSYLLVSLKEDSQPSHQADKKRSWHGLLSKSCPSFNLVSKQ